MGSITGTEDISLTKEDALESKQFASTARKIIFAHKATGGETGINLLSLATPAELSANGFVQPSSAEIAASRLLFNKKNFRLISSAPGRGELWMHDHYVITSEGFISFLNGITALPDEIFRGEVMDVPQTAIVTADARSVTRTFSLGVGVTLLNLGVLYKVGENLTAGSQVGSIKVWRNGQLQMRNVGNAAASPSANGNYQEYDPVNLGTSNQIQFNIGPMGQSDEIIVEFGLHVFSGDLEIYGAIEQLYGILFKLAQDAAPAFGNPLSTYLSANPSQVERRAFGDQVFNLLDRVEVLESAFPEPLDATWKKYTLSNVDLSVADTFKQVTLFSLPAKSVLRAVVIHHTTPFTGGAISDYTVKLGVSTDLVKYASAWSVFPSSSGTYFFQLFHADEIESMTAATNILLTAESAGDFLNAATQGSVNVYVEWFELP